MNNNNNNNVGSKNQNRSQNDDVVVTNPSTSSSSTTRTGGNVATVNNPYAKKRQRTTSSTTTFSTINNTILRDGGGIDRNNNSNNNNNNDGPCPSDTFLGKRDSIVQPITFSQAFSSFDNPTTTSGVPQLLSEQEQAERRAINFNVTGTSTTTNATAATNNNATDSGHDNINSTGDVRDYHVQFQPHVLYVSTKQRGNGVLKFIKNVPFAFSQMVPDYIVSTTTCALFLSIKYHQLYPKYVHRRISELRNDFKVRILLVLVDVDDSANSLLCINKLGVQYSLTVILSWSDAEAARYLETYKALDGKDATSIQKRESNNVVDQMTDVITSCKPCTKTDAASLWQHFGTLHAIADSSTTTRDELSLCPGLGPVKVQRLWDAFHKPFSKHATRLRLKRKKEQSLLKEQQQQQQQQTVEEEEEEEEKTLTTTTETIATSGNDDVNNN